MDGGYMTTDLFPVMSGETGPVQSLEDILAEARRQSLTRDNPLLADLPAWFTNLRDHQRIAVREILTAYEEGAECVVLDAPTGSGKTLIGETVRRLVGGVGRHSHNQQSTYICSSKALQDQFLRDYPYAKVLKGRSNYATERYPERFGGRDGLSAADCTKTPGNQESCLWCTTTDACEYERAKSAALRASLAVLNTSYFLSECNGPGRFSRGGLVIADEADVLESELMSHVEVRISERRLKSYGLGVPKFITKEESWREWAEDAYEKVVRQPPRQRSDIPGDIVAIRAAKRHGLLVAKLKQLTLGLSSGGWVYTGDRTQVAFKPVTVDKLGQDKLWRHGDRWLLMSATVISADEMLESLGWPEDKQWRLVKCPSTFHASRRKTIIYPVANMSYRTLQEESPKVLNAIQEILERHPNDRTLIHAVSYSLTEQIVSHLGQTSDYRINPTQEVSGSAERLLGVEGMEEIRVRQSDDKGTRVNGSQSELRITGRTDSSRLGDRSSLPQPVMREPGTPRTSNSPNQHETTLGSTDSLQEEPRIYPREHLLRQPGMSSVPHMQSTTRQRMVFSYRSASERDQALADYLSHPRAILVAPSMERGIDLPGDACRVQIICKVPYLHLGDKQVSQRLYGTGRSGKIWYAVNAIRTIIQMTGRAVRSEDDYAVTYILDRQFVQSLYAGYRNLMPSWWKEGLVWKKGIV